jgi:hypothetical protein
MSTAGWVRAHPGVILGGVAAAAGVAILAQPPMPQPTSYHAFADARPVWGIANAWNVLSNVPFAAVGLYGLARAWHAPRERAAWMVTFAGIAAVSLGSAWYHRAPSDDALAWDRWPMTVGFMGLMTALVARVAGPAWERRLLGPAVAAGIASVAYWRLTGDLRPYLWVQFTPMAMVLIVAAGLEPTTVRRQALGLAFALYALAKVFELGDAALFGATGGLVGGHALKHLAAAGACLALTRLIDREPDPSRFSVS